MTEQKKVEIIRDYFVNNIPREELMEREGLNNQKFTYLMNTDAQRIVHGIIVALDNRKAELEKKIDELLRKEEDTTALYQMIAELASRHA